MNEKTTNNILLKINQYKEPVYLKRKCELSGSRFKDSIPYQTT
jgi:hypothetical protein